MTTSMLIIGAGSIGQRHALNLRAMTDCEIGVFDVEYERANALAQRTGGRPFHDLNKALEERYSGVMICSPPDMHLIHATAAVGSAAAVFIEKPLATCSGNELESFLDQADRLDSQVMVGFNLRFNRCIRKARQLVTSGELGKLLHVEAVFGQYLPDWRPGTDYRNGYITLPHARGGGVIHDVAAHEIDYLTWLVGDVESISCTALKSSELEMQAEDTAEIVMTYSSGILGRIHADCTNPRYTRRFELTGTKGVLKWDFHSGLTLVGVGSAIPEQVEPPADPAEAYVLELQEFLSVIESGKKPGVDGRQAYRVLRLVEAAQLSAERAGVKVAV